MHIFIQLIQIALGRIKCLDAPVEDSDWEKIFVLAGKHALVGMIYKAITLLPTEQLPPLKIRVRFALTVEKIISRNRLMDEYSSKTVALMRELGLKSCVLKGQAVARKYPWPELRQSGDIDIWADKDFNTIMNLLSSRWKINYVLYHHAGIQPFDDKSIEVEVHFTPSWMYNPWANMKLQKYFKQNSQYQFDNHITELGFSSVTSRFDCLYSLVHIFRHLFLEGIGLRQILDYYFILKSSSVEERQEAYTIACRIGMKKFVSGLMYVISYVSGMENEYLLCSQDADTGKFLLNEILKAGNFGRYDTRNNPITIKGRKEFLSVRFIRRMIRLSKFTRVAPGEILFAPVFKVWQQMWCHFHRY